MIMYDVDLEGIVGATFGKASPQKSEAILTNSSVGLFDFVKINETLAQIQNVSIESDVTKDDAVEIALGNKIENRHNVVATLDVIGDINGGINERLHPLMPGSKLELATSQQIGDYLGFTMDEGKANIGHLKRRSDVPIVLDTQWFDKHISIMGMTGAGKSNLSKIILSTMQKTMTTPIIIIDPHGEYEGDIIEIDTMVINTQDITVSDVTDAMEEVLSRSEMDTFMDIVRTAPHSSTIRKKGLTGLDALIECCQDFYVRGASRYRKKLIAVATNLGVSQHIKNRMKAHWGSVPLVINLKGMKYEDAELIVKNVAETVLELGKEGKPLITFIDEVQNYCSQKRKNLSKDAIITLISEGRKFGCGVVIMSQRPAKVDKDIISQCNTKFCLKLTNENDIKQVRASTEYATRQMFQEVQKLSIGEALLTSPWLKRPVFISVDLFVQGD